MRRGVTVLVGVACLVALSAGATGGAASPSAKGVSACPDDTLCVWARKDYLGERVEIKKINAISNKLAKRMNNDALSLKNKFPVGGYLYDKKNAQGDLFLVCDESSYPKLPGFNDRASSSVIGSSMRRAKRIC